MKKPIQSGGGAMSALRSSVLVDILAESITVSTNKLNAVRVLAEVMSEIMQEIHGGDWRVSINHDGRFVIISETLRDEPISPKPEVM